MSMRRMSCALAVAAGAILVSGGCARDVLAPPARAESGATIRIVGPMPVGTDQQPVFIVGGVPVETAQGPLDRLVNAPLPAAPQPRTDVSAVLQARTEGVRVIKGTASGIRIRLCCYCSNRPLSPAEQPLVIVDGVRREHGRLMDPGIDPAQIVDIEILKGPSATERYGPEARYGVVLVRTRSASPAAEP